MASMSAVWIAVAFGVAATWGLTVVVNKRTLHFVDPIALNLLMRIPTLVFLAPALTALALTGTWGLSFDMTWSAFGWQTLNAVITWLVAFNAYFLVLRIGELGVVAPIMGTDPLFAGVFSILILGSGMGASLIVGLLVATCGVALLGRWMESASRQGEVQPETPAGAELVPPLLAAEGPAPTSRCATPLTVAAAKPSGASASGAGRGAGAGILAPGLVAADAGWHRRRLQVVLLALLAAAGWGLGPVIVELAVRSIGSASATLIFQNQIMGILFLLPLVAARRRVIIRRMDRRERRQVVLLIALAGALESVFALAFYLLIDEIGAVLTVLIIATSPLFTILAGMLFLRERYSWRLALGGLVTIAGVALAVVDPF